MIKRIYHLHKLASSLSRSKGESWYLEAHNYAESLSQRFGVSLDVVSGVISALSPSVRWERNKEEARNLIRYGEDTIVTTYHRNKLKALAIIAFGSSEKYLYKKHTSHKTYNFYMNILEPSNPNFVTIDRWMLRILGLEVKDIYTTKRYTILANSFIDVAHSIGIVPNILQATIWLEKRNNQNDLPF